MKPRGQILTNASLSFREFSLKIKESFSNFMSKLKGSPKRQEFNNFNSSTFSTPKPKRELKKIVPFVILGIAVLIAFVLLSSVTYFVFKNVSAGGKVSVLKPKASEDLNREFSFSLFGPDGKEVTKFKYTIEKAELRDEIIVNGKRARSVSGRTFLVLTVKIANDYNLPANVNSRDYVRLVVDGKTEQSFAADAHSDPIEVQPISTEQAILGFAINENDKNLVLRVGEIKGEKQEITLSLK